MPQRVLPSSRVLSVIREAVGDELVNLGERQHLVPRRPYRHRRQRYVGVRRFLITVGIARGSRHHQRAPIDRRDSEEFSKCLSTSPPVHGSGTKQRRPCYALLDTFRDIRRYSRASVLRIASRRREHGNSSCSPVGTWISIGPNHGVPRSAEARARAVCCRARVTVYHNNPDDDSDLNTVFRFRRILVGLFRNSGKRPPRERTPRHAEYPRSRLRGYCGRSIPTPPQRASPTPGPRGTAVSRIGGGRGSRFSAGSRSRFVRTPPSNGAVALPPSQRRRFPRRE